MASYKALDGQNIFDICLQTYGTFDKIYQLIQDSGFSSAVKTPKAGNEFIYSTESNANNTFGNFVRNNNIVFSTGQNQLSSSFGDSFDNSFGNASFS